LPAADLWSLGTLVAQFHGEQQAEPYYRRLLALDADHIGAHFALGRRLLSSGQPEGLGHIERVMEQEPDAIPAGCELLYQFYADRDDQEGIARVRQALYEHDQDVRAAVAEREQVSRQDTLAPAELPDEDVAQLRTIAQADSRISRLWIVRKVTAHRPQRPHLLIVIERRLWRLGAWGRDNRQLAQDIVNLIDLSLPSDYLVIVSDTSTAWLVKRVGSVPGAGVFAR
jgi:hypothetical protein